MAEAPAGVAQISPRARAGAGGLSAGIRLLTNPAASPHGTGQAIKRPGMLKIALTTILTLEASRTALQRNN